MPARTFVGIPRSVHDVIARWAEKSYPHEGCGLLIGRFRPDGAKDVVRLAPLTNDLLARTVDDAPTLPEDRQGAGAGRTEFVMNPAEFNRETMQAEKEGLDVVGIIHTHPDHPPLPSRIDESQPFLAFWSNVIVSVQNGKTAGMKSWFRDSDDRPFDEEELKIS